MLFGKRKEFDEKKIEQVMEDFVKTIGKLMAKYLPRRMRRTMRKNKSGWGKLSDRERKGGMEEMKKRGLSSWLNKKVDEIYQEIEPFASDPGALGKDLRASLKELKKKWKIK